MEPKILEEFGLSKNQAKVYLALLELGSSTATEITNISKVHRTNVYDALEQLVKKGLVIYIIQKDTKYFQANHPESLMNILKEKELKLQSILPQLELKEKLSKKKSKAHIFEGIKGIKVITDDILAIVKNGDSVLTFGCPRDISDRMKYFLANYHKQRIEKKVTQFHLYNENAKERIAYLNSISYTKAAYLPKEYDSPATTTIYKDKVSFFIWGDEPLGILIESEKMAQSYRKYFKLLWKVATNETLEY